MASFKEMQDSVLTATGLREPDRADAKRVVNDAYQDVCLLLDLTQSSITVTLTPGQGDYSISSDLGIANLVSIGSIIGTPSDGSTPASLEAVRPSRLLDYRTLTTAAGTPARMYALRGLDELLLYPTPTTTDTLTIYYTYAPLVLANDSDVPDFIPASFHRVIEDRAISLAGRWARDRSIQPLVIARADAAYQQGLREMRRWLHERVGAGTMEVGTIRSRLRRYAPSNRSTDTGGY